MTSHLSQQNGQQAENLALTFLKKSGYRLICQNFHSRFGEIDLIVERQRHLVFVEVKYRKNIYYGSPQEWVNQSKQHKIITTAEHFLQKHPKYQDYFSFRFDILSISGKIQLNNINWIKHAFIC